MPDTSVSFASSAIDDLEKLKAWYVEQGVAEVGDRLIEGILHSAASLVHHPDLGRIVPELEQPNLREIIHPPFRIVYRRDSNRVRIVRAWRSERLLAVPRQVR